MRFTQLSFLFLGLMFWTGKSLAQISIHEGVYKDSQTGVEVEVENDRQPGIVFIRAGAPYYWGLWINLWKLEAYKSRHANGQVVNLTPDGPVRPIDRNDTNLYKKTINELEDGRIELIFQDGSPQEIGYKRFSLIINKSEGLLEAFSHESSYPWKQFSWWPKIGNLVLFKFRVHTGSFLRVQESALKCPRLILL